MLWIAVKVVPESGVFSSVFQFDATNEYVAGRLGKDEKSSLSPAVAVKRLAIFSADRF